VPPGVLQPGERVGRPVGVEIGPGERLPLHRVRVRAVAQRGTNLNVGVVQRLGQQRQRPRGAEHPVRRTLPKRGRIQCLRQLQLQPCDEPAPGRLVEQKVGTAQQFVARPVLVGLVELQQALRPDVARGFAAGGRLQPVATGRAPGVADHAVGVVGAIEPRRVRLDECLEERERCWRILGQQLARHLVQPAVEHTAELARLAIAVELGRTPPAGQRLPETGGELVRPIGQLHPLKACLNRLVVLGELEQHRDQVPRVLTAEEGFQVFGGCLRHESGRVLWGQLDGVPWLKSQNVPCQFEIRPSVPQAGQRQTTTSPSAIPVSTTRRSRLRHLKQTGPGVSSGRSKSEA
jgi:hypothetical protein